MKVNLLNKDIYNYHVPFWKRLLIATAFRVSPRAGERILWKIAPYALVG